MRLIRHTIKPQLPLLLAGMLSLAAPLTAGELEEYPEVGPTQRLVLKDLGGNHHTLGDYGGQVVLVNFWASWCTPCLIEMPSMKRLKQFMNNQPFTILAVNNKEAKSSAWRYRNLLKVDFTMLLDQDGQASGLGHTDLPRQLPTRSQGAHPLCDLRCT